MSLHETARILGGGAALRRWTRQEGGAGLPGLRQERRESVGL